MDIDIEFEPVAALQCVTIMRNRVGTADINHEFLPMLSTVEAALRTQREMNQKQAGKIARLEQQISKL
jgi:hypothetical protein